MGPTSRWRCATVEMIIRFKYNLRVVHGELIKGSPVFTLITKLQLGNALSLDLANRFPRAVRRIRSFGTGTLPRWTLVTRTAGG